MSNNYGAIANQGVQQNLEGGGFQLNSQQNANIYSTGDAYGDYELEQQQSRHGGDGGDGVDGGDGGNGNGGAIGDGGDCCFDPCEAKKMAEDCDKDDCRPKCPDPCCDDGSWGADGNGGGGGGGGKGDHTGGAGGAGGYGFQINLGDATSTASGGGGGGAGRRQQCQQYQLLGGPQLRGVEQQRHRRRQRHQPGLQHPGRRLQSKHGAVSALPYELTSFRPARFAARASWSDGEIARRRRSGRRLP